MPYPDHLCNEFSHLLFPFTFFFFFLHCCSSFVHSCLTVIFTSVMLVLVTLFRPLDTALHPSSMNLQIQIRWILTLASLTKSSYPDISYYPAQVAPLPYPSPTSLSLFQDARQGLELVSGSRSFVCSHRRAHNRHSPRHERTRAPLTNYCRCCIECATDADTTFRYMDPRKTCRKCIIWPSLFFQVLYSTLVWFSSPSSSHCRELYFHFPQAAHGWSSTRG